jgi:hypothetical protein
VVVAGTFHLSQDLKRETRLSKNAPQETSPRPAGSLDATVETGLWLADSARQHVLARIGESARAARQAGVRPRLVIFDYLDNPVAGQLRAMGQDLDMLVGLEPIERSLPSASFRDRLRLLEKSKGIHGVFFPVGLTESHRACLESHPMLSELALDRAQEGFSPHLLSFLQLAAVHGWEPENRQATVVYAQETRPVARSLAAELETLGLRVTTLCHPGELGGALARSSLVWLCHGRPLQLSRLHLAGDAVVVDPGRAMELAPCFQQGQARLLAHQLRGFCPSSAGLCALINLNRIQRLLLRALGPRRPRSVSANASRRARG